MEEHRLYKTVYKKQLLWEAWRKVYENGLQSKSEDTQHQVKEFRKNEVRSIERISRQLRENRFTFKPAKGIPLKREGKKPRPIVVSPVENRIVQRSILDVLQRESTIQEYIQLETSFGGIESRGVKTALEAAHKTILRGAKFYLRSDIEGFFTKIPREKVLAIIARRIGDKKFNNLLDEATKTELENLASLGSQKDLFPTYEIGVAQGCCLSPLVGNVLLHDFDIRMNSRGISCLRYIDDFLLLGSKRENVLKAFNSAQKLLEKHGLSVYDPLKNPDKAECGEIEKGLKFLGCEVLPERIRPAKSSYDRLLKKVDELIRKSIQLMPDPRRLYFNGRSVATTLQDVSNVIQGWGNQYSFCNDLSLMNSLDIEIDKKLKWYFQQYFRRRTAIKDKKDFRKDDRRLLGVHLLADSKSDPIIT